MLPILLRLDPERAHALALAALKAGAGPRQAAGAFPRLRTRVAGLELANPLGLAAGFDKNAEVVGPLVAAGFGFVEVGAATPLPQAGNPRPRLFRLAEDRAAINRFGFNNDGAAAIAARLAARPKGGVVGLNLGANKASEDRAADYAAVLAAAGPYLDFATVNVSSPNTERLRELQGAEALRGLLAGVAAANRALARPVPVLLKIAPDMSEGELEALVGVALEAEIAGIIATNTTRRPRRVAKPSGDRVRGAVGGAALRAVHGGAGARPRPDRGTAAADRRGRGRLGRAGLCQDPRRRLGGPALYRARLRGARVGATHPSAARCVAGAGWLRERGGGGRDWREAVTRPR